MEPDGSVRTVQYKADAKSGFNAVVKNQKLNDAPMESNDNPGQYSVLESDGSVRTTLYKTDPKPSFKEGLNDIPMDPIDVWNLEHSPFNLDPDNKSAQQHSSRARKMLPKTDANINDNYSQYSMESLRLQQLPQMQDKSLRDYGKLEPAFDFPAFSSVGEADGKSKFPFDEHKEIPQLWSYREYLKKLSDESDKNKRHKKRGSYKKQKYPGFDFDLSLEKHPGSIPKETSFGEPTPEYSMEKYLAAQSNDFKKYISPFASNPFRLPNIFNSDFNGLKSLSDKPKLEHSDLHEYVSASEIAHTFPELDILKTKKKPYSKQHKYPGLLPISYAAAASNLEDDFIIIPKKKYLDHSKLVDPSFDSYAPHVEHNVRHVDEEFDLQHVHSDKCNHDKDKNKEVVVRKYVKKSKKPVINLLDIFDL